MVVEKLTRRVKETSINIVQTRLESIRKKDILKTGIRVYKDGLIGTAGAIGNSDENVLISEANEALKNRISYTSTPTSEKEQEIICSSELPEEYGIVEEVEVILEDLRKEQGSFIFSNKINITENEEALANDSGLNLRYKDRYIAAELIFKEKSSINVFDGAVSCTGRNFDRKEFLKFTNNICTAYKNKLELPKEGRYPVIFSTSDGTPLLKLLMDLNGRAFAMGSSLLSDKRDKRIFSPDFNFYQSHNPEDVLSPFFDAEGTVNENFKFPLIKEGIFVTPYTDKSVSTQFNLPLTGNAFCEYDGVPSLPQYLTGFSIGSSFKTVKELLGGEKGIFVMISSGGDFTQEGSFAAPVQLAFLYDGENIIGRLPEIQVTSNLFDMFGDSFRGVSTDFPNSLSMEKCLIMDLNVSRI